MPNTSPITDVHAMAFFNFAREYQKAANQLLDLEPSLTNPIYFLYFHTVELALKAFLRSFNTPILGTKRQSHKLTELYEECRSLGLRIGPSDRFEIGNIVGLLETGNEYQGFRYFNLKSAATADLLWTREVVEQLMQGVEPIVAARCEKDAIPEAAAKLTMILGRPV